MRPSPTLLPPELTSEDAATKKAMIAALEKFSDYENLKARLSGGQQEALEDIVQMTAYFCRRNVKGKDDGMDRGQGQHAVCRLSEPGYRPLRRPFTAV